MSDAAVDVRDPASAGGGRDDVVLPGYGDDGGGDHRQNERMDSARLGLWLAFAIVTMMFAAFTSAYLVRSNGSDWVPLQAPSLLWLNTLVLLASSVTMEIARRQFNAWKPMAFRRWLWATAALGTAFLVGQVGAWNQLAEQGVYVASHPHSSFFYVLTGVHALHLVAGVAVVFYVLYLATRYRLTPGDSSSPEIGAMYWHFVDVLWLYLLVVLFVL